MPDTLPHTVPDTLPTFTGRFVPHEPSSHWLQPVAALCGTNLLVKRDRVSGTVLLVKRDRVSGTVLLDRVSGTVLLASAP